MLSKLLTPTTRIALILGVASLNSVFIAQMIGLFPDIESAKQKSRFHLAETIGISLSGMVTKRDEKDMESYLGLVAQRNPDIVCARVIKSGGEICVNVIGDPQTKLEELKHSMVYVPIVSRRGKWGKAEIYYQPMFGAGFLGFLTRQSVLFSIFLTAANALVFIFYLRRVLMHLDPSKAVPDRVKTTLDSISDGLAILDEKNRVVLANRTFAEIVAEEPDKISGRNLAEFDWEVPIGEVLPWESNDKSTRHSVQLKLQIGGAFRTFVAQSSAINGDDGAYCGALVSFNDVTMFEHKRAELLHILKTLKRSREKIEEQNDELRFLATRDPMTKCLNRRSFFEIFDKRWVETVSASGILSCMMVDVDHFKSINDNYGHSMGDEVLRAVSRALMELENEDHFVCRYGGEEFCVLLLDFDLDAASEVAERICKNISELVFEKFSITASLGVSSLAFEAENPEALLDQADAALYAAKRGGRNRVVRWDKISEAIPVDQTGPNAGGDAARSVVTMQSKSRIPFQTVASLLAALGYRNPELGAHSVRVADMAVELGKSLMPASKLYVLEVAALLHDIGKIGVPDAILKKDFDLLTKDEAQILGHHTQIGVDIVVASFDSESLIDFVLYHSARYEGHPQNPGGLKGDEIPIGARVIAIANAYDSMIHGDRNRDPIPSEKALEKLEHESGKRFDPELVERFVELARSPNFDQQISEQCQVPRNLATEFGLQTEQLANAIDEQNFDAVSGLITHMNSMGKEHQIDAVCDLSDQIELVLDDSKDLDKIEELTNELIEYCTKMQTAQVDFAADWSAVIEMD